MAMSTANPSAAAIPDWSQLDFARNCSAYGQWLAAFIAPNPWNPAEALGGSIPLTILLVSYALPPGWVFNATVGGNGGNWTQTVDSPAGTAYFGVVTQWLTGHLFHTYNASSGQWSVDPAFVDNVIWAPADKCQREFCKAIAFTGNADLSGIGVVISYYMEASLTTLYLLVFTAWRIKRFVREQLQGRRRRCAGALAVEQSKVTQNPRGRGRGRLARAGHRCFNALRGSLDGFLMAAGVLAIAILVAALVVEAFHTNEMRRHPVSSQNIPSGHALYDSALGLLVGLFAVFPPVVLYALLPQEDEWPRLHHHHHHHHRKGRRTWLRRAVLVVLWALAAAVVFLDPPSELDFAYQGRVADSDDNFAAVLYACDQRGGLAYWQALEALKYLVIGVPVLWLAMTLGVYVLTGWRPWRPWRAARGRGRSDEGGRLEKQAASEEMESKDGRAVGEEKETKIARAAGEEKETKIGRPAGDDQKSLLARIGRPVWRHIVAWLACLIMWMLLLYLTELRHSIVDVADGLDMENKWAIGQVLAIATWGPVAVDFGFLLIFGIEAGLGSRLPLDFAIRQVGSTSSVDSAAEEDEDETGAAAAAAAAAAAQARGSSPDRANANSVHNRRRSASSAICRQTSSSTAETVCNDKTSVVGKCDCGEPVAPLALSMSSASSSAPSLLLRAQS